LLPLVLAMPPDDCNRPASLLLPTFARFLPACAPARLTEVLDPRGFF
jgi:hypothetical protein